MARSEGLRQEIDAMSGIERIMTALPPRVRYRVVGWVLDNFNEPGLPPPAEYETRAQAAPGEEQAGA